jgi:hypothetical protein
MEVMNVPQASSVISKAPSRITLGRVKRGKGPAMDFVKSIGKKALRHAKDYAVGQAKELGRKALDKGSRMAVDYLKTKLGLGMKLSSGMVGIPVKISVAQKRTLKRGGAITISPKMIDEASSEILSLLPKSANKILRSLSKEKGIRHALSMGEDLINQITGRGFFDDVARAFQPQNIARAFEPVTSAFQPQNIARAFEPVTSAATKTFTPQLGRDIAKTLIDEALPRVIKGAVSSGVSAVTGNPALGMAAAETLGSLAAEKARVALNKKAGYDTRRRNLFPSRMGGRTGGGSIYPAGRVGTGIYPAGRRTSGGKSILDEPVTAREAVNFFRYDVPDLFGAGLPTQLGSPYISTNSPAFHPFIATRGIQSYNPI